MILRDDWTFFERKAVNRYTSMSLPDEVRALLGLADIAIYEVEAGVVRLCLSNKHGMRWSNPIPQRDLHMFGVMEQHIRELLREPIVITVPDED